MGKDGSKLKDLTVGDLINLARSRGGVWLVELACDVCLGGHFQGQLSPRALPDGFTAATLLGGGGPG